MTGLATEARPAAERRWRLRRRLGTAFAGLAVVLVALTAVAAVAAVRFTTTTNEVIYRWQRAYAVGLRSETDLVDQETGVRGYALTHEKQFLQPYESGVPATGADLALLRGYIGGDSTLRKQLAAFASAIDSWRASVVTPDLARVRAGGALSPANLLSGKRAFDAIRARSATLLAGLRQRTVDVRAARTTEGLSLLAAVSFALLVLIGAALVLWRGLLRWVLAPIDSLGGHVRQVASGATGHRVVASGPQELTSLGSDVEAMREQIASQLAVAERVQTELRRRGAELARSNEDLQQFAYVASHDLSEPLRKVSNFCQLLERQYGNQLDDRARQYIGFAVDGAKRMQMLITDLLALSRVGRATDNFEQIDIAKNIDIALANLEDRIVAAHARVELPTPMPVVDGDRALLASLWENLIGNAVKYRREDVEPVVQISAELDDDKHEWLFTVSDNGIGINHEYAERIFAVFQRLHLRDQYGGTGIGLALCRRIVEFHGGRIWLADVASAEGATFRFTLPERNSVAQPRH